MVNRLLSLQALPPGSLGGRGRAAEEQTDNDGEVGEMVLCGKEKKKLISGQTNKEENV